MPQPNPATSARPSRRWPRIVGVVLALFLLATLLLMLNVWSALGSKPSGERLARIERSPQYRDGHFVNTLPTLLTGMSLSTTREFFFGGSDYRLPAAPLPVVTRTAEDFAEPVDSLRVTWLGHSTLLIELEGVRVLVDPVWGERASPSSLFGPKRFYAPPLDMADLPPLDAIVISHDHYDHLDEPSIRALADQAPRFIVPLGVGSHLEYWGVEASRITELDWWDEISLGDVRLVSTPSRHFSGRSLNDRDATLWSSWAFVGQSRRLFYTGDTALAPEFAEIGERLGPFDLSLIEIGAYNQAWADVHLGPEQAVAVHQMVRGGLLVPVHWGLFDLSTHGWTEPIERLLVAAEPLGIEVALPRPGESIRPNAVPTEPWWPAIPWETAEEKPVVSSGIEDLEVDGTTF